MHLDPQTLALLKEYNFDPDEIITPDELFYALDEIAHDFLLNDLSYAEGKDLAIADPKERNAAPHASAVKAKIYNIELTMQKLRPSYETYINKPMTVSEWNPPKLASLEDFFKEFAYYYGSDESKIEEAAVLYVRFHPEANLEDTKEAMKALSNY